MFYIFPCQKINPIIVAIKMFMGFIFLTWGIHSIPCRNRETDFTGEILNALSLKQELISLCNSPSSEKIKQTDVILKSKPQIFIRI